MSNPEFSDNNQNEAFVTEILAKLEALNQDVATVMRHGTDKEKRQTESAVKRLSEVVDSINRSAAFEYGID